MRSEAVPLLAALLASRLKAVTDDMARCNGSSTGHTLFFGEPSSRSPPRPNGTNKADAKALTHGGGAHGAPGVVLLSVSKGNVRFMCGVWGRPAKARARKFAVDAQSWPRQT